MKGPNKTRYALLAAVVVVSATICVGAFFYYRAQERQLHDGVRNEMLSIAELKVSQLVRWRQDRLLDAQVSAESPFVGAAMRTLLLSPTPVLRTNAVQWFSNRCHSAGYSDIMIADTSGNIQLNLDPTLNVLPPNARAAALQAVATRTPLWSEIYVGADGHPSLDAIAPLAASEKSPVVGVLIFHMHADKMLFPVVLSWPVKTRTSEALLVRKEGDHVLYLNEVRHNKDSAMKLRVPITRTEVPAVHGALGYEGYFEGSDYRGVPVLSVARRVPGSEWVMVIKQDRSESVAALRHRSWLIVAVVLGLILLVVAFVGMIWQHSWRAHYEDLYRSELALSREKERLAVTLRSIGEGVITTDTDGKIVFMNQVAERLTGWTNADSLGLPLSEVFRIVHEHTKEPRENPVARVLETRKVVEIANHTMLISRNDHTYLISDSGAPVFDPNGEMVGVVLVFRDVTEERRLEYNLYRAQKLEAIGVLAGGIAHDFNNLLGGIFGYLDLARSAILRQTPDKALQYVESCIGVFDRARDLTHQLLTFAKGGTPLMKTGVLSETLRDSTLFALSGSNVSSEFHIAPDLKACDFDPQQMGQVIDNLVINAKQAMPGSGRLYVSARNTVLQENEHPPLPAGEYVEVSFRDTGVGMPPEILPRVFDPFFSTKQMGSGLGLATVYSIIQRHNGAVDVESAPGKGTTFRILLPVSAKQVTPAEKKARAAVSGSGRVLVMDDEEALREIASEMLSSLGYQAALAADGQAAIEMVADSLKQGSEFSAAILDLTVPGRMGGKEAAAEILKIDPNLPLIVASGYSSDPVMAEPREYGFSLRIPKPYLRVQLAEALAAAIGSAKPRKTGCNS